MPEDLEVSLATVVGDLVWHLVPRVLEESLRILNALGDPAGVFMTLLEFCGRWATGLWSFAVSRAVRVKHALKPKFAVLLLLARNRSIC